MAIWTREDLFEHRGHALEVAAYGPGRMVGRTPESVTIECLTCHEVLVAAEDLEANRHDAPTMAVAVLWAGSDAVVAVNGRYVGVVYQDGSGSATLDESFFYNMAAAIGIDRTEVELGYVKYRTVDLDVALGDEWGYEDVVTYAADSGALS